MENQAPTATVETHTALAALWLNGDIIARSVLVLLLHHVARFLVRDPHQAVGSAPS